MVRRHYAQLTLWRFLVADLVGESVENLMDPELRCIDQLLDDDNLVEQVLQKLRTRRAKSALRGRGGAPAETVLRLLALKHLRDWSDEQLEREVRGSLVYRYFCRLEDHKVPDASAICRYGQLVDAQVLRSLMARLIKRAVEEGVTKGRKLRVDTTVVEAPIRYPTDSRLCEDAVRVLRRTLKRLAAAGVQLPFELKRVGRAVSRRVQEINDTLRRRGEDTQEALKKPYRGLLRITARLIRQAEQACLCAREQLGTLKKGAREKALRQVEYLERMTPRARQAVKQTRARVFRGITDSPKKIISLFEPYAQILRRGKPHRPTEFGLNVKVQEAEGGLITDIHIVHDKTDYGLLVPSVDRHIEIFGHPPDTVATDRGFYSKNGEQKIIDKGVKHAAIPKPGKHTKQRASHEKQRWFRRARAWRAGGEGRISYLKHQFGMARSRYRGEGGMERAVLWAGIANNLYVMARAKSAKRKIQRRKAA